MRRKIILILLVIGIIFLIILRGSEDTWICEPTFVGGSSEAHWVKHGNPSFPKPLASCNGKEQLPNNKEDCLKKGGVWEKQGPEPFETCDIKTKDGGRECSDVSQCEGTCMVKLSDEQFRNGIKGKKFKGNGVCSQWRVTLGCFGMVKKSEISVICID